MKGNKLAVDTKMEELKENQKADVFKNYSLFSRHLYGLIKNELFADVFFEVEGEIVPAHRNILVYRSDYFKAMICSNGAFKESFELGKSTSKDKIKPIFKTLDFISYKMK